jgi:uncharacterized protein YyaL (SSP411 family)
MNHKRTPNRLIHEKSPYLLQHAWNPVDWMPWGNEAFEKAKTEDKPIFLSVGYSTCHWCHVMEHESFEDEDTAALLNRTTVSVKVDREEHPDLDRLYMTFVQASTGRGGWPMSVWLTPDLKPFYGGSYFPPEDRYGMPGFRTVLSAIERLWKYERNKVLDSANGMMEHLLSQAMPKRTNRALPSGVAAARCAEQLEESFDRDFGGFGDAPKFPRPVILNFLFNHAWHTGSRASMDMALFTLQKMTEGGIHDHISTVNGGGGGFSRYSTDAWWHVPHFEKMLYDNAQLAVSCLEAWQCTRQPFYADTARDIFNYVLCDLSSPSGGYYSAEDADSFPEHRSKEMKEGAFYLWSKKEIMELLGPETGMIFCYAFNVHEEGNARQDPHGEFAGKNILMAVASAAELSERFGKPYEEIAARIAEAKKAMFTARLRRPRPRLDDKVLTSWNGLMITAFAKGFKTLHEESYLLSAKKAADFLLTNLYDLHTGKLLRRYRDGESAIQGKADDYAFLIQGLLDLYEASFDTGYLQTALQLAEKQAGLFYDTQHGGFFSTAIDDKTIPLRLKDDYDGAEPSANAVSILNCLRLAEMTGREDFRSMGETTLRYYSGVLAANGLAMPQMLIALNFAEKRKIRVVFAGELESDELTSLRHSVYEHYLPGAVLMHASSESVHLLPEAGAIAGENRVKAEAYLCVDRSCRLPVHDPEDLVKMLVELAS